MTDIRELVQCTLDVALTADSVRVHWLRKSKTTGEDPDEYIVYTLDESSPSAFADDVPIVHSSNVAVRYYYRNSLLDTSASRAAIKAREAQIFNALAGAGFTSRYFDAGDIDDIGYGCTVFEANCDEVV